MSGFGERCLVTTHGQRGVGVSETTALYANLVLALCKVGGPLSCQKRLILGGAFFLSHSLQPFPAAINQSGDPVR